MAQHTRIDAKELNEILRSVDKDLRKANKAVEMLNECYKKMKAPRTTASMGFVSPDILFTLTHQDTHYHKMPMEVQYMVWSYLVHQPDRTALALTCKWNARMHEQLEPRYRRIAVKRPRKEHRIAVLLQISSWMGKNYRLCFCCVRYHKRGESGDWGGDTSLENVRSVKDGRITQDAMTRGPRCPACRYRDGIEQLNHKHTIKELKSVIQKYCGSLS